MMRILVVDDDDDVREVLGYILRSEGHEVEEAVDGIDALEHLRSGSSPSLILLDLMMPRLDGEDFVREMRKDCRFAGTPVFIISGHDAASQKAAELEVAGCLVKPVELQRVLAAVRSVAQDVERHAPPP